MSGGESVCVCVLCLVCVRSSECVNVRANESVADGSAHLKSTVSLFLCLFCFVPSTSENAFAKSKCCESTFF